ncbi:MAG: hypothetical protein Q9181_007109 [Wetmoreana brouardii]
MKPESRELVTRWLENVEQVFYPSTEPVFSPSTGPVFSPSTGPVFSPSTEPILLLLTEPVFSPPTEPVLPPSTEPTTKLVKETISKRKLTEPATKRLQKSTRKRKSRDGPRNSLDDRRKARSHDPIAEARIRKQKAKQSRDTRKMPPPPRKPTLIELAIKYERRNGSYEQSFPHTEGIASSMIYSYWTDESTEGYREAVLSELKSHKAKFLTETDTLSLCHSGKQPELESFPTEKESASTYQIEI